jgi:diguanylate cyclase (GGDEF)-like protein
MRRTIVFAISAALLALSLGAHGAALDIDAFLELDAEAQAHVLANASPEEARELLRAYKNAFQNARQGSERDALTGMPNRRALARLKADLIARGATVALVMIDLDHFKRINDTLGHEAGDRVLKGVAGLLRGTARDLVFRLGGEEFLLVAEGADAAGARTVSERLRAELALVPFDGLAGVFVTGSFGVASGVASSSAAFDKIFERADAAAYLAKGRGRNQVISADEPGFCEKTVTK